MKTWLVDTGPLVAFLDARDPAHDAVVDRWSGHRGRSLTTSAVVTEAMHFVAGHPKGPLHLAELIAAGPIRVDDVCQPAALHEAAQLMQRYADTAMDFADATLVLLADALGERDVLTLDRRGFATYRTPGRKGFRLVLDS